MIEVFKGVAEFFKEYMYKEELYQIDSHIDKRVHTVTATSQSYRMHTGPTTSPENSYTILLRSSSSNDSQFRGKLSSSLSSIILVVIIIIIIIAID